MRTRPGWIEPEVYFRVVHAAQNVHNGTPVSTYREQAVEIVNQADIARQEGITRARVIQVLGMLHLAPEIRENILSTPNAVRRPLVTERVLRPIATITDYHDQIREFHKLLG